MFSDDKMITRGMAVGGLLLVVATPQLPRDLAIVAWLAYAAYWIWLFLGKARRKWRHVMTIPLVLAMGIAAGLIASIFALIAFPPPEKPAALLKEDADPAVALALRKLADSIPQTTGLITPGSGDPSVVMSDDERKRENIPDDAIMIGFGSVGRVTAFPFCVVKQDGEELITINKSGDGISLSAKLFNAEGKVVCEFVENQFHLSPGTYFRKEAKDHSLKIVNHEANQFFLMEFIDPSTIRIQGDFYIRNGVRVIIGPKEIVIFNRTFSKNLFGRVDTAINLTANPKVAHGYMMGVGVTHPKPNSNNPPADKSNDSK